MTDQPPPVAEPPGPPIPFVEFVALVASLMALTALGIDTMLPALPAIAHSLGVADHNAQQFVITAFVGGFGVAHLIHGPLTDRYGRRPVMIAAMLAYAASNFAAALAGSFTLLLVARAIGGASVAAVRVVNVALVRDCFHGRAMAKVMSIAFMVFMIVPVLAPAFGAGVVAILGDWRAIFWTIAVVSLGIAGWFWWRMPETLAPERRLPINARRIVADWRMVASDRLSLGYTAAATALLGSLYGYLNSVQQIMAETFGKPRLLVVVFATSAATMAAANLFNARLVTRLGTRRISHSAVTLLAGAAGVQLALALSGVETLLAFGIFQAIILGAFGLAAANFSAMAMERMGGIAGTASSVQGFVSVTAGTAIGAWIGQGFDGTTVPLATGYLVAGLAALGAVAVTERGRLFRPS